MRIIFLLLAPNFFLADAHAGNYRYDKDYGRSSLMAIGQLNNAGHGGGLQFEHVFSGNKKMGFCITC